MGLLVRDATDADSSGIVDLVARVFAEYPGCVLDVEAEEPELLAPATSFDRFWVIERAGEIVGCGGLAVHGPTAEGRVVELKKLYLDPSIRGRGYGRMLTEMVEGRAREIGAPIVELWSDTRFVAAHGLYTNLGYEMTGRTRDLDDLSNTTEYHFERRLPEA